MTPLKRIIVISAVVLSAAPSAMAQTTAFPYECRFNDADLHGVALAAIQGLNQRLEESLRSKEEEIRKPKRRLERIAGNFPGLAPTRSDHPPD